MAGLDVALAQSKTFDPDFNHRYLSAKGTPKLLGLTNREGLLQKPFNEWFATGYNEYDVDMGIVNRLKTQVEDLTMKYFLAPGVLTVNERYLGTSKFWMSLGLRMKM